MFYDSNVYIKMGMVPMSLPLYIIQSYILTLIDN